MISLTLHCNLLKREGGGGGGPVRKQMYREEGTGWDSIWVGQDDLRSPQATPLLPLLRARASTERVGLEAVY